MSRYTPKRLGHRTAERQRILNSLFYLVHTGCAKRLLTKKFEPWETVYVCFRQWNLYLDENSCFAIGWGAVIKSDHALTGLFNGS